MTPDQTPIAFEDLIEVLDNAEGRMRKMRSMSGSTPISTHAFLTVLLTELRDLHALRLNTDQVMAARKAAIARSTRELPLPPARPHGKEGA